ncbi:MAG: RNA-binding protein [Candidatus Woykebacteria bacterium RIFCSPHIGHO2_12_FULL_43_10]|uniref:RNA-binding protein n=2 Tax=Candidatus Woykeibacteriota TaxID=1817899 RepID=A0A1G1WXP5_9BACT|nr:MAG: RNA-binding protein [Candidatus Woykebacteria bacterium RIFCSPHIGHO2_02_FULL_43_16b]OGY29810.1 MAG: RNA-binding protein [Candidatus Woykebacteria bacterium RIFCSPHIGHO2_12_FULL_43_10]OGY32484.1 MAG: RNA-binding protein [Candidatus Woykebacteria bacterium RIFCSPLOWO2_01_FULL_43_14]
MAKKLFVGSLPYQATSAELEEVFAQAGKVDSVNVIMDKFSGQSKGFAFVEMSTEEEAQKAVSTLNGADFQGRKLVVSEARPQEDRNRGGFGDRSGGGFRKSGGFQRDKRW